MKPKALAVDVDGTITENGGTLNLDAVAALRWMEKQGIRVVLASGRGAWEMYALAIYAGTTKVVVTENGGAVAVSPVDIALLSDKSLSIEAYEILSKEISELKLRPVLPRLTEVILERNFDVEKGRKILEKHGLPVYLNDSKYAYHLTKKGINKATGLKVALRYLNIDPSETIAIGDSETDLPMFDLCAYGIALANAPQSVRDKADHVVEQGTGTGAVAAVQHIAEKFLKRGMEEVGKS